MDLSEIIIGKDPALKALLQSVKLVALTDANVLIEGETGTGKELIASAIQKNSRRKEQAFIIINCAALSQNLSETELFGSLKGAFTGADADKKGLFAVADSGTLFLDEINSLHIAVQAKLLRFLDSGTYTPVGAVKACRANVRIISATNTNLHEQIKQGKFREDLYFRLNSVPLRLPPLRERPNDIQLLLKHFMEQFAEKYGVKAPKLTEEVIKTFHAYAWPGNIRELRNVCEYLIIQKIKRPIEMNDLPTDYKHSAQGIRPGSLYQLPENGIVWQELEISLIKQALAKTGGNRTKAAKLVGLSRDALDYRIKKFDL